MIQQKYHGPEGSPQTGSLVHRAQEDLAGDLARLRGEHGHASPICLDAEERLARQLAQRGDLAPARSAFEDALLHRAVANGDQALETARVACDLFKLLCEQGDRAAMAEVYYRYLWWLPMRNPTSLAPELKEILDEVDGLIDSTC